MIPSVRAAFRSFTEPLEGVVPWMYLDIKGLVTIGIGNLIDPAQHALRLPFIKADGTPASQANIAAAWMTIKGHTELAQQGYLAASRWTEIRLSPEGIDNLVMGKLDEFAGTLLSLYPEFDEWPADAQLATLSMAWACGPAFGQGFPSLRLALLGENWVEAARQCHINEKGNAGIVPRNKANKQLYANAERVRDWKLDPTELQWPRVLEDSVPTQPELPAVEEDDGPVVVPPEFPPRDIDTE